MKKSTGTKREESICKKSKKNAELERLQEEIVLIIGQKRKTFGNQESLKKSLKTL